MGPSRLRAPGRPCLLLGAILLASCSDDGGGAPPASGDGGGPPSSGQGASAPTSSSASASTGYDPVAARFPTPRALYERAVAPSCAGAEGSCHRGWAQPDLSSFEAFIATAGAFCQTGVGDPRAVVDGCERPGDRLVFADGVERALLRVIVPEGAPRVPSEVTVTLDGPAGDVSAVTRVRAPVAAGQAELRQELRGVVFTPLEPASRLRLDLSRAGEDLARAFDLRRWPRRGADVVVGDANGNGRDAAGAELRQLVPGRPDRSFLYLRLLGDALGARMPLVESGWSEEATRALYCFVRGLPEGWQPDTRVADEPIAYAGCPGDPEDGGPAASDIEAVQAIFDQRCASGPCHGAERASGLDLRRAALAGGEVIGAPSREVPGRALIAPGAADESYLVCKIEPGCAERAQGTAPMPVGGELGAEERTAIRAWIEAGAKLD
ncbi:MULTISPECIES: hypothetical protein [Sorangium]|uniref:Cytochrome C Planctomycete-type domain-containing protein n=1 Tax=Sorangium cellulosum TaxID=56 RepID=A0A4P2QFU4_SORCE|nr:MULTISPECIES: hypothetical protein [Sorangium]AUX28338.1 uncharacterized protein SOCE836_004080 [Sorangium cellulosum]WCQ87731.1 hypothetical protein NQZ70_00394 [Sorangium sp. Soce836]